MDVLPLLPPRLAALFAGRSLWPAQPPLWDGAAAPTSESWRRQWAPRWRSILADEIYGRSPEPLAVVRQEVETSEWSAVPGSQCLRSEVTVTGPGGEHAWPVTEYRPAGRPPAGGWPWVVFIHNREPVWPPKEPGTKGYDFLPVALLLSAGVAVVTFHHDSVVADERHRGETGVFRIFPGTYGEAHGWGAVAAWGWAATVVREACRQAAPEVYQATQVAVVGHSRGGKAALCAAAFGGGWGAVYSNNSGCTGAALARGKTGERIADIVARFPFWFARDYQKWVEREAELPCDHHHLLALQAPRLLYVASALDDAWADPAAELAGLLAAAPAWDLWRERSAEAITATGPTRTEELPEGGQWAHWPGLGYHLRAGRHNLVPVDWALFLRFLAAEGWSLHPPSDLAALFNWPTLAA